jgi:adenylate cyclase
VFSKDNLIFWSLVGLGFVAGGLFYTFLFQQLSVLGPIYFAALAMPVILFERGQLFPRLYAWMNTFSNIPYLGLRFALYHIFFFTSCAAIGTLLWSLSLGPPTWVDAAILPLDGLVYSFVMSLILIFTLRVRDLIGHQNFTSMMVGRYRWPREEERLFLLVDLIGSTSFAERHGGMKTMSYLKDLFEIFALPVSRYRGSIDDYLGDAVLISWNVASGIREGACIRCICDVLHEIQCLQNHWCASYGETPRLRMALHCGLVTVGEIGKNNCKITYFGDTINTTSRIEMLCKELCKPILLSDAVAERLPTLEFVTVAPVGQYFVKGKSEPLCVSELRWNSPTG